MNHPVSLNAQHFNSGVAGGTYKLKDIIKRQMYKPDLDHDSNEPTAKITFNNYLSTINMINNIKELSLFLGEFIT